MTDILVIMGNPNSNSYCDALAREYVAGATASGARVTLLRLNELSFDPVLHVGYGGEQPLEPDLERAQTLIRDAHHVVWVYPTWWSTMPALMRGFIDRVFLPGFAFAYTEGGGLPQKLLKGKTARLIVTADSPWFYYSLILKAPGHHMMKKGVLEFVGFKPVKVSFFSSLRQASEEKRKRWMATVKQLGLSQV